MTVILTILGRKGGITKSTSAVNVAAGLALMGLTTLFVETDGQGNSSRMMGMTPRDGFQTLIKHDAEWNDVMDPVPDSFTGEPCQFWHVSASDLQWQIEGIEDTAHMIVNRFSELHGIWDVVVVDTSPSMNYIHKGLHIASTHVLLPTLIEEDSVLSIGNTLGHLYNSKPDAALYETKIADVLGILPNRFSARSSIDRAWFRQLVKRYGSEYHIYKPVREYAAWKTARAYKNSIWIQSGRWADNARADMLPVVHSIANLVGVEVVA